MNSGPALDDYLMELLGDVGVVTTPLRPAPEAVLALPVHSDEAVLVLDAPVAGNVEASVVDAATVASIIEEMEREFALPPEAMTVPVPVKVPEPEPIAEPVANIHVAASIAPPSPMPAPVLQPTSAPRLPPSGSPAMTLLSPIATPRALPPLPSKPFLQTPIDSGARRRAAEPTTRWLRMRCDEQHYALELLKVQEVVLPGALLPLRGAARHMLGVMNLRGQVVPVLDLGLYLGRCAIEPDASTRIVVLEEQGEILGLRVSAVEDVTNLTEQQIEPPDNARVGRIANHLFRGVARLHGRAVILLDASQLLR